MCTNNGDNSNKCLGKGEDIAKKIDFENAVDGYQKF